MNATEKTKADGLQFPQKHLSLSFSNYEFTFLLSAKQLMTLLLVSSSSDLHQVLG